MANPAAYYLLDAVATELLEGEGLGRSVEQWMHAFGASEERLRAVVAALVRAEARLVIALHGHVTLHDEALMRVPWSALSPAARSACIVLCTQHLMAFGRTAHTHEGRRLVVCSECRLDARLTTHLRARRDAALESLFGKTAVLYAHGGYVRGAVELMGSALCMVKSQITARALEERDPILAGDVNDASGVDLRAGHRVSARSLKVDSVDALQVIDRCLDRMNMFWNSV